jgi:hypothetical protein
MLVLGIAVAQSITVQKPVECVDTATLLQGLSGSDYKEKPIWLGVESGASLPKYSLFVNEQTKTWTLIQFDEKIACVLGIGENSTQIFTGPKI